MRDDLQKLIKRGFTQSTPTGAQAVPVTLMYTESLAQGSRRQRKEQLKKKFEAICGEVGSDGSFDLDSVSPSGMTVRGQIAVDAFDRVEASLKSNHVRVDLDIEQKLT